MPFWLFILIGAIAYIIAAWIVTSIYASTTQGKKFTDDELFGLGIVWPLIAFKGLLYVIFKSGRGSVSGIVKLFRYW